MKIKNTKQCVERKVVAKQPATKKPAVKKAKPTTKAVTFTVHAEKGKTVYLAGEFNAWDPTEKKMTWKATDGVYAATIKLAPGRYEYKFVLDGVWCADPENANYVTNDQGTFNSVIIVE